MFKHQLTVGLYNKPFNSDLKQSIILETSMKLN